MANSARYLNLTAAFEPILLEMNWTQALVGIPGGFVRQPSGLFVPAEPPRPTVVGDGGQLGDGTPISKDAFFVMANPPSSAGQMRVVIDEGGVGLPQSDPDDLRGMAEALNFEIGMLAVSRLSAHTAHLRGDTGRQLKLAPEVFGDQDLVAAIARLARREAGRLEIFPEQHASILQRLLVLHGRDSQLGEVQDGEQVVFNQAWLAAATFTDVLDHEPPGNPEGRQQWIAFLIQNGTYNHVEDSLSSMIRPQILLGDIANSEALRAHPHFCEIEAWHRDFYGLDLSKQFSLGLALCGVSSIFEDEAAIEKRSLIGSEAFSDILGKLDCEQGSDLVSASRDWYRSEFETRSDSVNAAWDRIPFEKRPLLRLADGQMLVTSPRALEAWLGDGVYHRTLAAGRERGLDKRFLDFYGALVEEYALRIMRHVHPEIGPLTGCRVSGEQSYGTGGGKKSPDIAVDCGPDLILFEVCSGRFTLRTIIEGSPEAALNDLGRLIFSKAEQLSDRIDDFLDEEWRLPGLDTRQVERIWPVVVSADVLQNEMLWDEIGDRLANVLGQPKVQRLTLLDLGELEQLAALVENGHSLLDLVAQKARGAYALLDFRRFAEETPGIPTDIRLSLLDQRWRIEVDKTAEAFGFDASKLDDG